MIPRRTLLQAAAATSLLTPLTARADESGTLTVALSNNPVTCDPINLSNHDMQLLSQTIWENLVEYDINGILKPQLAKALPQVSADKLIYTFDLRDDVFFQNGQKLTSEDVKYSFEYMLDPAHKAARAPIFNRLSHVETDGPYRCHVVLKEPYAPWVYFLTKFMGIWPKGSREQFGDSYFRLTPKELGTGVGIFEEWIPNDSISFRRNPNYWQKGLPHWDRLVVKFVPEDATRVAYLLTGQADIIAAPPAQDFARLKTRKGIQGEARPTLGGWTVMLTNNARPPFDDIEFRRALSHAIDRKTLAEKIFFGMVEPSAIPAPAAGWWFDQTASDMRAYDPDKARAHLAKSKYANGAQFELLISSDPYLLDCKDAAVYIQSELAKFNITATIRMAQSSVVSAATNSGDYQANLTNSMSAGEPTYFIANNFIAGGFMSRTSGNIDDPVVRRLMARIHLGGDQEELKPVYAELLRHLADQAYYCWLGYFAAANLWRDRVKNFRPSLGVAINVHDVSLA
ncbi:MAG: peptide/nickel transport system substrate-binding protein [Acetobacteraceae bacterium]|nr:peptide/nickel transport system substrate-binding protein [Acetobacteraceae bacterium]